MRFHPCETANQRVVDLQHHLHVLDILMIFVFLKRHVQGGLRNLRANCSESVAVHHAYWTAYFTCRRRLLEVGSLTWLDGTLDMRGRTGMKTSLSSPLPDVKKCFIPMAHDRCSWVQRSHGQEAAESEDIARRKRVRVGHFRFLAKRTPIITRLNTDTE